MRFWFRRGHRRHMLLPCGYRIACCAECHRHFQFLMDRGKAKIVPAVCSCPACKAAAV